MTIEPILSDQKSWNHRVLLVIERADLIILDVANVEPGLAWEFLQVGDRADLLEMTLTVRAAMDEETKPELDAVLSKARWRSTIARRDEPEGLKPLALPADLLARLVSASQGARSRSADLSVR